jgi:hypothetical protein
MMFTKGDALAIKDKLNAEVEEGRKHTIVSFHYKGLRIVSYGIRRGSRKDQGHDFLPRQLHLSSHHARRLADCPMSLKEYIGVLQEKGVIPPDEKAETPN